MIDLVDTVLGYIQNIKYPNLIEEMSNISTRKTGLDQIIYFSIKPDGKHKTPRVKISLDGSIKNSYPVSISDSPLWLVNNRQTKKVSSKSFLKISAFITRNKNDLLHVWNGEITTDEFFENMKDVHDL